MTDVSSQTLHLVARELTAELNEARAALEHFGELQDGIEPLRQCADCLHRAHGALRVVEVYGAALLAEEMEQVAKYLLENFGEKRHLNEGLDALMRAMVQLPTYLERVLGGGRDMALVLLPLLNDLRAVRGNALLSEGTLLLLNLTSDQQANPQPPSAGEEIRSVAHWARKLRTRFQLGLLGWIKGERRDQNLEILGRTAEKLEQVATTQPVFQLWWVVGAVLESMRDGGLEEGASVKRLLGQADREMRKLYELGEARYSESPALDLLNNLLYYVARARSSGPRVVAVRASFRLNDLLPIDAEVENARESLAAPSLKLMKTVAAAIKEDLQRVKDALDIFVRKGGTQTEELGSQLELLKKLGDTLGVLGLGGLRDKVQGEAAELQRLVAAKGPPEDAVLVRIASTLINIEDGLDEQLIGLVVPQPGDGSAPVKTTDDEIEFRQVTQAVLRECIVNMARIKEAIAQSIEKPREPHSLDHVPQLLRGITAGLLMLGKNRAVEITEGIGRVLSQYVQPDGSAAATEQMDRLADAIVAVEYYMETIQAGRTDPWYMLDNADVCLQVLADHAPAEPYRALPVPAGHDYTHTLAVDSLRDISRPIDADRTEVLTSTQAEQVAGTGFTVKVPTLPASRPTAAAPAGIGLPPVLELPPDKSDPEFLELFIEEAKEEMAKLRQLFPMWDENPQDQDSLVSVRRSFHTLKGSGRMVGARLIGEFAWAVENLLNRVLSKTLDRSPDIMTVLREAVAAVPELVEQLETARAPSIDIARIISQAQFLTGGRESSGNRAQPAAPPPVEEPILFEPLTPEPPRVAAPPRVAMDPVLHEIFSKEAVGHLATVYDFIAACSRAAPPYPVSEALHRSCHTLSGIARTAEVPQGSRLADPLNHYIRKLFDNGVGLNTAGLEVLKDAVDALGRVVSNVDDATVFDDHGVIVERITQLDEQLDAELSRSTHMADQTLAHPVLNDQSAGSAYEQRWTDQQVAESNAQVSSSVFIDSTAEPEPEPETEPEPWTAEASAGSDQPTDQWADQQDDRTELNPAMPSALADVPKEPAPLDFEFAMSELVPPEILEAESQRLERLREMPPELEETVVGAPDENTIQVERVAVEPEDIVLETPPGEEVFSAKEAGTLMDYAAELQRQMPEQPEDFALDGSIDAALSEQSGSDSADDAPPEYAAPPELIEDSGVEFGFSASTESVVMEGDGDADDDRLNVETDASLQVQGENSAEPAMVVETSEWAANYQSQQLSDVIDAQSSVAPADETVVPPVARPSVPSLSSDLEEPEPPADDFDADVAAIFSEEAGELLETADSSLSQWTRDRSNSALAFELKRALHTLKGGARMAGIRSMGDLSHEVESFMEAIEAGRVSPEPAVFEVLQASIDELGRMRDALDQGRRIAQATSLIHRIRVLSGLAVAPEEPVQEWRPEAAVPVLSEVVSSRAASGLFQTHDEPAAIESESEIDPQGESDSPTDSEISSQAAQIPEAPGELITAEFFAQELADPELTTGPTPVRADTISEATLAPLDVAAVAPDLPQDVNAETSHELPVLPPGREPQAQERQEFARVDADLLDNLLNNAGEVSIFRSRLEQQVSSIEFNLAELGRTVTRLKDQLRKLELETEAQVLHKHHDDSRGRDDFDPLELDRYSSIQQLSRALAESVSDVASIEGLLENLTREGQNLLMQQARVVTELQNGLMRTRMVPFQRHVQRLSRLVRQVAADTHKRAELVVSGASGELDRQVLERMLPPFEHMLRNSVVHGIETPEERRALGKPEAGTITIGLHREGAEMVIVVQDDGRGIDVQAVRERARARGLLQAGRALTDEEALQLVLEPGFSTASEVTQHAGRGVGMDVVVAEIKKLGGALFTQSTPGQGVRFTIRLPFTLAISQALIVRTGEELYALPLPTIEGVVRVPRDEVLARLADDAEDFSYGGQTYRFQYLGVFVGAGASLIPETETSIPVVLIRAGEHSTGLVLDELVGSREIVVKSLGPQISGIRGISGATILGDGRIVIILDMGAMVRSEWRTRDSERDGPLVDRRTFAMVVDDSITVRRVTQRLLERNGMRVMTAKDGVDALSILQDHVPDIILLDIEMPRMDGYELASHVRGDPRLADIPIVMITSRSGEKHRARAIELGVNEYLGKPYQESQLLDAIEPLVEARRRRA